MPTESFYKLDKNKREKIVDSMKKEFSRVSFHEASVNRIVEDAGISKGSFWVYFKSKEDSIEYLIESHLEEERKKFKEILINNNGDLFKGYLGIYEYLQNLKLTTMEQDLMANIFSNLISNPEKCIKKKPCDNLIQELINNVNTENLNLVNEDDLINVMRILNYSLRMNLVDLFNKKMLAEQCKERFIRTIEILKHGISKERVEEESKCLN